MSAPPCACLRTLSLLPVALVFLGSPAFADDGQPSPIFGGSEAQSCQWAAVVALADPGQAVPFCSGTVITPSVVLTAAHCVGAPGASADVHFGESASAAALTIGAQCFAHAEFSPSASGNDVGYCILDRPAPVQPIPLLAGCEAEAMAPGLSLTAVGFGAETLTQRTGPVGHGIKRIAEMEVQSLQPEFSEFTLLGDGQGPCLIDSGGPALVQVDDGSWRVAGPVSRVLLDGAPQPGQEICSAGTGVVYTAGWQQLEWLEDDSAEDVTPCHDADGVWAPTPLCGGFPLQPDATDLVWADACNSAAISGSSETCGPPFDDGSEGSSSGGSSGSETGDAETGSADTTGTDPADATTGSPDEPGGTGSDTDGQAGADTSQDGCGCRHRPRSTPAMLLLLMAAGVGRRRQHQCIP
ncbi:MAG: trypsin-like serine protease [Deltaproteobacteria bacterium]|nr:trypsin-like serine protease [Deltaproteobacteria bacterium]